MTEQHDIENYTMKQEECTCRNMSVVNKLLIISAFMYAFVADGYQPLDVLMAIATLLWVWQSEIESLQKKIVHWLYMRNTKQ